MKTGEGKFDSDGYYIASKNEADLMKSAANLAIGGAYSLFERHSDGDPNQMMLQSLVIAVALIAKGLGVNMEDLDKALRYRYDGFTQEYAHDMVAKAIATVGAVTDVIEAVMPKPPKGNA